MCINAPTPRTSKSGCFTPLIAVAVFYYPTQRICLPKQGKGKILDLPSENTLSGLRDRAILSIGLQVGLRRAEIAALKVSDLHQNRGFDSLKVVRKGGRKEALAINPQTAKRIQAYLECSNHREDDDGPLFRSLRHNGKRQDERRPMTPDAIDRVVRKYASMLGLKNGYSAHSMRATFITTALENGASLAAKMHERLVRGADFVSKLPLTLNF
jgi:site-specific recombinase XerD